MVVVAHEVGPTGGMERQLTALISGLIEHGLEVTLLSRASRLPPHPRLRWIRVPGPARPFSVAYPWFALVASGLLLLHRRHRIVHTTGAIVFNRADVMTVHLCHHGLAEKRVTRVSRKNRLYLVNARLVAAMSRFGERWCYTPRRARHLVGVSGGVSAELHRHTRVDPTHISVIPNGIDRSAFRPDRELRLTTRGRLGLAPKELVALFVGSEWEGKGLRHALGALAEASEWTLVVVGKGDEVRYRRLSHHLGVENRTRFVGPTTNTAPYYAMADAFVLPTAYETFSLVTYEAAASGLPLLVTRVSGVEDLLLDGVNGWFIEQHSHDIACRLRQLEANPDLRSSMARSSREGTRGFGWESSVAAYIKLYRELGAAAQSDPRIEIASC